MEKEITIHSFNVNGIRACINKGFLDYVGEFSPDILCLQETKANKDQVDEILQDYPHHIWNSAEKKGYSGTAIFSKIKPLEITHGIGELDEEGRVITAEFENYYLITVYTPNSKRDLSRLNFRYENWDVKFLKYVKKLEEEKPVIFCGDLNVAHKEIDLKNDKSNKTTKTKPGTAGFTDKEREGFDNIIDSGFIDTFRELHPTEEKYSWWSYMFSARTKNVGWRIDYFCVSNSLKENLVSAEILNDVLGSDHCPIELKIKL